MKGPSAAVLIGRWKLWPSKLCKQRPSADREVSLKRTRYFLDLRGGHWGSLTAGSGAGVSDD